MALEAVRKIKANKKPSLLADICKRGRATQFNHPSPQNHRAFLLGEMGSRNCDHIWTLPNSQPLGLLHSLPVISTSSRAGALYLASWLNSHCILPT